MNDAQVTEDAGARSASTGTNADTSSNSNRNIAVGVVLVAIAAVHATVLAWTSDDAFISFRYARNLVDGLGLVFNAGERVEGYSNPLWTVMMAAALKLGARAETASMVLGIAAYGAAIAALVWAHAVMRERVRGSDATSSLLATVPAAALIGALHPDWATFATSGLETSLFTTLVLAGSLVVLLGDAATHPRPTRAILAGAFFGLAAITRPEGILLGATAGLLMIATPKRRPAAVLLYGATVLVIWATTTAWRWRYYGDVFPNTYYAKSGGSAWWSVGLRYVGLYMMRSWTVPLACVLAAGAALVGKAGAAARWRSSLGRVTAGALVLAIPYTLYIARVGGDFMFGRMLVPVTPLFLLVLDAAVLRLTMTFTSTFMTARAAAAALLVSTSALAIAQRATPCPAPAEEADVVDERGYYNDERVQGMEEDARILTPFFQGIPARVAIYGSEARLAYLAPFDVVIEARAGLTDAHIAHQVIATRGRVGHEKAATFDYLIGERRADITFSLYPEVVQGLDAYIPKVMASFGSETGRMLHWDPAVVAAWRSRGADVDDFPASLDRLIASLDQLPDDTVRRELARCDHFYFDGGYDAPRRARFLARLAR